MLGKFFVANGDTLVYGDIAKNLLQHGHYALTLGSGEVFPTLIRLPGYPLFLAVCFRLFGMENYGAVAWVQIALELGGCLLLADFARLIAPPASKTAAAQATLWLAALCPFTAVYAATPLTEGPTLFVLALALCAAARFQSRGLKASRDGHPGWVLRSRSPMRRCCGRTEHWQRWRWRRRCWRGCAKGRRSHLQARPASLWCAYCWPWRHSLHGRGETGVCFTWSSRWFRSPLPIRVIRSHRDGTGG